MNAIAVTTSLAIEEAAALRRSTFLAMLNVVRKALRAAWDQGERPGAGTRGVVVGVVRGACFAGTEPTTAFADVAEAVLKATSEMSGDLEVATHGLIAGALEAARKVEVDEAWAVAAASWGALETVEEFREEARLQIRRALGETVAGTSEPGWARQKREWPRLRGEALGVTPRAIQSQPRRSI